MPMPNDEDKLIWPMSNHEIKKSLERAKDDIERALEAVTERPVKRPLEPFDGLPRLRPHGTRGWWQVWSGGICISLLSAEDVQPIKDAK